MTMHRCAVCTTGTSTRYGDRLGTPISVIFWTLLINQHQVVSQANSIIILPQWNCQHQNSARAWGDKVLDCMVSDNQLTALNTLP